MSTTDKTVLVTGSSRGIGKAIALRLARDGYRVVVHCRSRRIEADAVATDIEAAGGIARVLQFDIGDRAAAASALLTDVEAHGCYYGVVCNAGIARDTAFPAMLDEEWDQVIAVNLTAAFRLSRAVLRGMMKKRWGRIIQITSVVGATGNPGQANYAAAKAGIAALTLSSARGLARLGVRANAICPGPILTPLMETLFASEEEKNKRLNRIPLGRFGRAEDIVWAGVFLASDESSWMTGSQFVVDGGITVNYF